MTVKVRQDNKNAQVWLADRQWRVETGRTHTDQIETQIHDAIPNNIQYNTTCAIEKTLTDCHQARAGEASTDCHRD